MELLIGTTGHNNLDVRSASGAYEIHALAGDDTVQGSVFDDLIIGGPGWDQMFGNDGDDTFLIDSQDVGDTVHGGNGTDTVLGSAADDVLVIRAFSSIERFDGGEGYNVIRGTETPNYWNFSLSTLIGIAQIEGMGGDDQITGSAADDRIVPGAGNDIVDGGAGTDTVVFSGNFAAYTFTPLTNGRLQIATAGADGIDTVRNVEIFEFADGIYADGVFTPFGDPTNTPPLASADTFAAVEDTALVVNAAAGVLANDSDPNDDPLGVIAYDAQSARGGTVVMNADGSFTYTPAANVNGTDSFQYTVGDGRGGSAVATVTINLQAVNDVPSAQDNSYNATQDQALIVNVTGGVLANDTDPDGDSLTVSAYDAQSAQGGTVVMNPDGSFTYTPPAGFTGSDSFSYTASDGTAQDSATVTVGVSATQPAPTFQSLLESIPENEWVRLNVNSFQDVWTPQDQQPLIQGTPKSIIHAWSAAAWDSNRGEYIIWGGGHANYPGNEVYTWSSVTLEWERASLPSDVVQLAPSRFETVDGYEHSPISSHAYDNLEFLEIADRMINFGGAAWNTGAGFVESDGVTKTGPYLWDPSKADPNAVGGLTGSHVNAAMHPEVVGGEMWENRENWPSTLGAMVNGTTDYALIDGVDVVFVNTIHHLFKYTIPDVTDPGQDTWELVGITWNGYSGAGAGAYDPVRNLYVRTSGTEFTFWDLDNAGPNNRNISFIPDDPTGEFSLSQWWGMEYDPVRDRFVLWEGDATVWFLEAPDVDVPGADGWSLTKASTPALPAPEVPDQFRGVLGKWDYVDDADVFIGVTDPTTGDIWAYKPEDWAPDWLA